MLLVSAAALRADNSNATLAVGLLGQVNFNLAYLNSLNGASLNQPQSIAVDRSVTPNRIYLADQANNRVLVWEHESDMLAGKPADRVIGQRTLYDANCNDVGSSLDQPGGPNGEIGPDTLCGPTGVAVDSKGNLYVADTDNSRVLEYDHGGAIPAGGGTAAVAPAADRVFGKPDFYTTGCPTSATCFTGPQGVAVDSKDNLYVADAYGNRVLEFNTPLNALSGEPGAGDTVADNVFGQDGSFTSSHCNGGTMAGDVNGLGPDSLCLDQSFAGIAVDGAGNLYVADMTNNRILRYNTPLEKTAVKGSGDTVADLVFGQPDFVSSKANQGGASPSAKTLSLGFQILFAGLAVDSAGDLYASDIGNNRVLIYYGAAKATVNDPAANVVFGQQGMFNRTGCDADVSGQKNLCDPAGLAVDGSGNLLLDDPVSSRALEYNEGAPPSNVTANALVGQLDFAAANGNATSVGANGIDAAALYSPHGLAIDRGTVPNHIYAVDQSLCRVLGWKDLNAFQSGAGADLVIGQSNFFDGCSPTKTAQTLSFPYDAAVDSKGNLYVVDNGSNPNSSFTTQASGRVLEFDAPFNSGMTAGEPYHLIFYGCGTLTTSNCAPFFQPEGLAVDSRDNLWVADTFNNRMLEYNTPLNPNSGEPGAGDENPDFVIGQTNFTVPGQSFLGTSCVGGLNHPNAANNSTLCLPMGAAMDSADNLYVADFQNNRVMEFNTPLRVTAVAGSGNAVADLVIGQGNFSNNKCNEQSDGSSGLGPNVLCKPTRVALDSNQNLYVADNSNNRVTEYNTPLNAKSGEIGAGDAIADLVYGQANSFLTNGCNFGLSSGASLCYGPGCNDFAGLSTASLCAPQGIATDSSNSLYVADSANARVLQYPPAVGVAPAAGALPAYQATVLTMGTVEGAAIGVPAQPGDSVAIGGFTYSNSAPYGESLSLVRVSIDGGTVASATLTSDAPGTRPVTQSGGSFLLFVFNPPVPVAAGDSVNFSLSVKLRGGANDARAEHGVALAGVAIAGAGRGIAPLVAGLALLDLLASLLGRGCRRRIAIAVAIALLLAAAAVGCGGGSSSLAPGGRFGPRLGSKVTSAGLEHNVTIGSAAVGTEQITATLVQIGASF